MRSERSDPLPSAFRRWESLRPSSTCAAAVGLIIPITMSEFQDLYAAALAQGFEDEVDFLTSPDARPDGDRAVYRLVFRGMQVHGAPSTVTIAGASISFIQGPVLTQRTELAQRAGFPLVFDKAMKRGVEIGAGHWLTVVQINLTPVPEDFADAIIRSREQAQTAVAFLSAVLDERIAQEQLAEDLVILDGPRPVAAADLRELVRSYLPFEARDIELDAIKVLESVDVPRHVKTAARWYLRGSQAAPGVDGVIFLWFAVEALVGTSKKAPIEKALRKAGRDPADQGLGVGRLHGLRSKFVHDKPASDPPPPLEVRQAFYDLEAMARALLRHALGAKSTWPAHTASRVFGSQWQKKIEDAWKKPVVEFHDHLPGSTTEPVPGMAWGEMLPAIETKAIVTAVGGQGQDANRLRRIVEIALTYFGDPDVGEFPVEIKRLPDDAQADCRKDRLVISSRIADPQNDPEAFRLFRNVHVFVGRSLLARLGVPSNDPTGWFLHGILSGWVGVHLLVSGGAPLEHLTVFPLKETSSAFDLGEQLGAGIGGSPENLANARRAIKGASETKRGVAKQGIEQMIQELRSLKTPSELLETLPAMY
jgi:hypothetical protein